MKTTSFSDLGLSLEICQAIEDLGFQTPTPVQSAVIPLLLKESQDIIALAQTGTGKTAAFGLPLLQNINHHTSAGIQALVLAPTRELTLQITRDLKRYALYMPTLSIVSLYGGANIETQIKALKKGCQIVVATPGRLQDLMRRGALSLHGVKDVVLDEADEMLNMGFSDDIDAILAEIPKERHLLLFSATMPTEIRRITKKYMSNPIEIRTGKENVTNDNIRHTFIMVHAKDKYLALKRICDYVPDIYGIIFCRTRKDTQEVADLLIQDGYSADALHGDLSQAQRDYVMQKFRLKGLQLLVATDVAARGLDVSDLTHVIHYALPEEPEIYTHRSGRTARAGKSGTSIAICHIREKGRLKNIEKIASLSFEQIKVPSGQEICEKQLFHLSHRLQHTIPDYEAIEKILTPITKELSWMTKEDLLERLVYLETKQLLDYYEKAPEIEEVSFSSKDKTSDKKQLKTKKETDSGLPQKGYERLSLNFGRKDRIYPNTLIDIVNKCMGYFIEIGKIDIRDRITYFEVPAKDVHDILSEMNDFDMANRQIRVNLVTYPISENNEKRHNNSPKRDRRRKENHRPAKKKR